MTRPLLALLVCLMAIPAWADPPSWARPVKTTVTKTADSEEVIVEVNNVKAGRRQDKTGVYSLVWERDPWALGLTHRLHAHKITKPFPAEHEPLRGPQPDLQGLARDVPQASSDNPVVIDVNYFYSAAASAEIGGDANMPAFMALSCALANQAYVNSGLGYISMRCLGPFKTPYVESGTTNAALTWMYYSLNPPTDHTSVNYHGNQLQAAITQTGADISHMVTTDGACGVGYLTANPGIALSQSARSCTNDNLTFPHESGHNIGYQHDPASAGCTLTLMPSGLMGCPSGYNYGHAWPIGAVQWRSVMSYPGAGGQRVTQFSNPNILWQGQWPTGVPNERDNARIAVARAPIVSAFRTAVVTTHKPPSTPTAVLVTP